MSLFSYHTVVIPVTAATGVVGIKALGNSADRLGLIVSSDAIPGAGNTANVQLATGQSNQRVYYSQVPPVNSSLAYRDYGPLIQAEIWIFASTVAGFNVFLTELTKVAKQG